VVVEDREDQHAGQADQGRLLARGDGVGAQRRIDGALLDDVDLGLQAAGAQDDGEVVGLVQREVARDDGLAAGDLFADVGRGIERVVEDDRQVAAAVRVEVLGAAGGEVLRDTGERAASVAVERKLDLALAEVAEGDAGAGQVLARNLGLDADVPRTEVVLAVDGFLLEQQLVAGLRLEGADGGALGLVRRIALADPVVAGLRAGQRGDLVAFRALAGVEQRLDQLVVLLVHDAEGQVGRRLDVLLGAVAVLGLHARDLHHDARIAVRVDVRFGDAHRVDSVADHFDRLVAGVADGRPRLERRFVDLQRVCGAALEVEAELDLVLHGQDERQAGADDDDEDEPFPDGCFHNRLPIYLLLSCRPAGLQRRKVLVCVSTMPSLR